MGISTTVIPQKIEIHTELANIGYFNIPDVLDTYIYEKTKGYIIIPHLYYNNGYKSDPYAIMPVRPEHKVTHTKEGIQDPTISTTGTKYSYTAKEGYSLITQLSGGTGSSTTTVPINLSPGETAIFGYSAMAWNDTYYRHSLYFTDGAHNYYIINNSTASISATYIVATYNTDGTLTVTAQGGINNTWTFTPTGAVDLKVYTYAGNTNLSLQAGFSDVAKFPINTPPIKGTIITSRQHIVYRENPTSITLTLSGKNISINTPAIVPKNTQITITQPSPLATINGYEFYSYNDKPNVTILY